MAKVLPITAIGQTIFLVRGQRVLLSHDLARLYGVEHRALIQAVRRNATRFPADFVFRLTPAEVSNLRSQIVISSSGHGGSRYPPMAFTEQGVAMLSGVLRSRRAVQVNVEVMREFVRLRRWLSGNKELAQKVSELEKRYDGQLRVVFEALEQLLEPPEPPKRRAIGFRPVVAPKVRSLGTP